MFIYYDLNIYERWLYLINYDKHLIFELSFINIQIIISKPHHFLNYCFLWFIIFIRFTKQYTHTHTHTHIYIYIYIYIWANSNENSSFVANVRASKSATRITFSINNKGECSCIIIDK